MIGIVDYGMGNLRSVQKALQCLGADARIVNDARAVIPCDKLVLPGVGAFGDAMAHLRQRGLIEPIVNYVGSGKPFLGICLGLQLLFEVSDEDGPHEGLGILSGRVMRFAPSDSYLKVPQMGWNALRFAQPDHPMLGGLPDGCHVYFVHSYYAQPANDSAVATWTDYDVTFCSAVAHDNVFATQFHPEKSQAIGLRLLENFVAL